MNILLPNEPLKKEEIVLVIPSELYTLPEGMDSALTLNDLPSVGQNGMFVNRDLANRNPDMFRQVATYSVIWRLHPDDGRGIQVLAYRRTGGDGALLDRISIGWGGHVELQDAPDEGVSAAGIVQRSIGVATQREIFEELYMHWPDHLVGDDDTTHVINFCNFMILDDRDEVGKRHIGVPSLVQIHPSTMLASMDANNDKLLGWVSLGQLAGMKNLEGWSEMMTTHLIEHEGKMVAEAFTARSVASDVDGRDGDVEQ